MSSNEDGSRLPFIFSTAKNLQIVFLDPITIAYSLLDYQDVNMLKHIYILSIVLSVLFTL